MPREVNPPRAYESPVVPRIQPSRPSSTSTSSNRAESAPVERAGVSGLRRGGPFGFHHAVVSRGSTLRNSMKPRPSATDAVIVEKSTRSPSLDSRNSKLLTPPSSQEAEGEEVNPPSFEQSAGFNFMDRENSEVPQSPMHPSLMRRAVSETEAFTSHPHAGPSKPRYSARTFFDDEDSDAPCQSTTPSAAPPASYHTHSYFSAGSPPKTSRSRKRNSASQQPESVATSPNTRSKKQSRRSHPPSDVFSTPQPQLSMHARRNAIPRTEKPMISSNRRKLDPLSKSLSYPASSMTTSVAARRTRRSTPHVNGKSLKAPMFMIPDFVPKGTSMDPDPPPPPPSPGDDPILLVGSRSDILSQSPAPDGSEEENPVSSHRDELGQDNTFLLHPVSGQKKRTLAMLNEDEDMVKSENDWGNPGFETDLDIANRSSASASVQQEESENEEDQHPDVSYVPGSKSRSFNEFVNGLVPGLREPSTSTPLSSFASRNIWPNPISSTITQPGHERTGGPSITRSSFSPPLPNILSLDEDAENILGFSIPPPGSSRSPSITPTVSCSPFSITHSRSSQTPVPKSISPNSNDLSPQRDISNLSVPPSELSRGSPSNIQPVSYHSSPRSRSSSTPISRSPTPRSESIVSFHETQQAPSPLPNALPVDLQPRPLMSTPFLNKRSITLNHTPAPILSPYVFQPPGTPESYSGSSEDGHKVTGMHVPRQDSVDRVFDKLDDQWGVEKEGGMENEENVEVSEWARKIRSSLSPDSDEVESENEAGGAHDDTVVLSHHVDTRIKQIEIQEEEERDGAVEADVKVSAEQSKEKYPDEVLEAIEVKSVKVVILPEFLHGNVGTPPESVAERASDHSLDKPSIFRSAPEANIHTDAAPTTEIDHSHPDPAHASGKPKLEEILLRRDSSLAEEGRNTDEEQEGDASDGEELSASQQEPTLTYLEQKKTLVDCHSQVNEPSFGIESARSESLLFSNVDIINQGDHDLASLKRDTSVSHDLPTRPTVASPSFRLSTYSLSPALQTSSHQQVHEQTLLSATSLITTPSLSPPPPPPPPHSIRINTPSKISLSSSTLEQSMNSVMDMALVHPSDHEERGPEQSTLEKTLNIKGDIPKLHRDQVAGNEKIGEATVVTDVITGADMESSEEEEMMASLEDSFLAVKTRRRQSLAEEMQAAGEEEYGIFDDTIDFGEEESSGLKNFMDGFEGDEVVETDTVEARADPVGPNIQQNSICQIDASQTIDASQRLYSTPSLVAQQHLSQPASRSWTRIVPPSPSPSTGSSISSDTVPEAQNFSFLGKTQDFIVELNDISDGSLDDQIENIIQERSIQESSFRMNSPKAPVRPPLPNKISSEKLSGINELFRKRHAGGHVAMSTPLPAQHMIPSAVPRPAVSPVTFLPSIPSLPFRGISRIARPLRGGLHFPKELERPQLSVPSEPSKKAPVSLSAPVWLNDSSTSPEFITTLSSQQGARTSPVLSSTVAQPTHIVAPTPTDSVVTSTSSKPPTSDSSRKIFSHTPFSVPHPSTASSSLHHSRSSGANPPSQAPSRTIPSWTARQQVVPSQSQHNEEVSGVSTQVDVNLDHDEEKEEGELETYIKITSNDPKEAARATAFLKLFHDYVETGLVPLNPDSSVASAVSIRNQSNLDTSIRSQANQSITSNANISMMSAPELLMEAEQEIAAEAESSDEETIGNRVQELSIPGSFASQSSLTELIGRRAKTRVRNLADHVWGPGDWRCLMNCLDAEGGKTNMDVDPERVVTRFIREMALNDRDLVDEWDRSKLYLRVTSIQTRRRAEAANPPSRRRRSSMNPSRSLIIPNKASSSSFTRANYRSSPLRKSQSMPSEFATAPSLSLTDKIFGFFTQKWKASAAQLEEVVLSDRRSTEAESSQYRDTQTVMSADSGFRPRGSRPISPVIIPPSPSKSRPNQAEHLTVSERRQQRQHRPKSTASHPNQLPRAPYRILPPVSASNISIASTSFSSSSSSFRSNAQKTPVSQHPSRIQPRPLSIAHLPPRSTLLNKKSTRSPIIRRQAPSNRLSTSVSSVSSLSQPILASISTPAPIPIPASASTAGARGKANDLPVRPRSSFESSPPKVSALVRSFESVGSGSGLLDEVMGGGRFSKDRRG